MIDNNNEDEDTVKINEMKIIYDQQPQPIINNQINYLFDQTMNLHEKSTYL